jgi:hypothetical protein
MAEVPAKLSNKAWLRVLLVAGCSIPFLVKLPFGIYVALGAAIGIVSLVVSDLLFRRKEGHGLLTEVYNRVYNESQDDDPEYSYIVEDSKAHIKIMAAVTMVVYSVITHAILWPGILVVKLLIRTIPSLDDIKS